MECLDCCRVKQLTPVHLGLPFAGTRGSTRFLTYELPVNAEMSANADATGL
jgi:hypothetical protein